MRDAAIGTTPATAGRVDRYIGSIGPGEAFRLDPFGHLQAKDE